MGVKARLQKKEHKNIFPNAFGVLVKADNVTSLTADALEHERRRLQQDTEYPWVLYSSAPNDNTGHDC